MTHLLPHQNLPAPQGVDAYDDTRAWWLSSDSFCSPRRAPCTWAR
jgi:hypothetical protein